MNMLAKLTTIVVVILLFGVGSLQAQRGISHETQPLHDVTGFETPDMSNNPVIAIDGPVTFEPVQSRSFTWDMHNITSRLTGYDYQSNASPQQLWIDNSTGFLHAIFMNSQESATPWSDRTCLYFGSVDAGLNWFELGPAPVTSRCGYPAIYGNPDGSALIMDHSAFFDATTRTMLMIDASSFGYSFSNFDPGVPAGGSTIWPRHILAPNGDIVIASSQNGPDSFWVNTFDQTSSTFSGWVSKDGQQGEQYTFGISNGGKIGLAYLGQPNGTSHVNDGDIFLEESTDNGQTWSPRVKIYERDHSNDTTWGAIRGLTLNYYGEEACISWETAWQDFVASQYRQGDANTLYFWSANINGGQPKVLYDSSWVHWNPGGGANDVYMGVSRPVLSRTDVYDYLFLTFSGATEFVWPDPLTEQSPYFAGWFTYSSDGGDTWAEAEKFTPDTPLMDWKHPTMPPIYQVNPTDDGTVDIHIVIEGDSLPGSTVNAAAPMVVGVTAAYYHFSTTVPVVNPSGVDDEIGTPTDFNLEQNYPNPFNPSTSIKYSIAERNAVTLKVYDVLGNEVATLINTTQDAGAYEIEFDAATFASGLYFYTLQAGNFTSTKKMILLK
jgi:hypothetical protein